MKTRSVLRLTFTAIMFVSNPASAQPECEAYFPLDGNLSDASGNGYDGMMIAPEGAAATPQFVDGKISQALRLDGKSAMRAFVDLNSDACKQLTVAAWVLFEPGASTRTQTQYVISTGAGSGPGFRVSGSTLVLNGTANGLMQLKAIRENAGWTFIAGAYDYEGDSYTLHWRGRSKTIPLGPNRNGPEEAIWVGAFNDSLSHPAGGVLIDELRIYGRILSEDEIRGLQAGKAPELSAAGGSTPQSAPTTCSTQADCSTGSYCAFDNTCHPESHLPKRDLELIVAPAPTQTVVPIPDGSQGDSGSPSGMPGAVPGGAVAITTTSSVSDLAGAVIEERVEASRPPDIGYASEEEAQAAAARREREAYEAELARQQNELERLRREEAAAAEAAAAAANTTSTSDGTSTTSNGSGVAIGGIELSSNFVESGISGISGAIIERVDLEVFPMNSVSIDENNDKPCEIGIANGSFAEAINRCGVGFSFNRARKLSRDGRWGVTALRVGDDLIGTSQERVKGLWLEFAEFDDSGGLSDIRETDSWTLFNSTGWKQLVSCPDGHVATGLVAHMYPGKAPSAGTDYLAGLKLICREVVSGR